MGTLVEMRFATLLALQLCLLFVLIHTVQATEKRYTPIRGDLKYIRCEVCERLANVLHTQAGAAKSNAEAANKKFRESDVTTVIDQVCEAEPGKGGEWILKFDVVNEKDTLKLKRQSKEGACRRECKTIADSCQDQLDSFDNLDDLQVALWKGAKKKDIRNQLCTEWSTACAEGKKAMSYTGKRKDEQFLPNDEAQEQELVELKKEQQKRAAAEASASKKRAKSKSSAKSATADQGGELIAAISAVTGAVYQWVQGVFDTVLEFYNENKKYLTYKKTKQFLKTSAIDMHKELWTKMTWKRIQRYGKFMMKVHSPARLQKDKKVRTVFFIVAVMAACLLAIEAAMKIISKILIKQDSDDEEDNNKGVDWGLVMIKASAAFFVVVGMGAFLRL